MLPSKKIRMVHFQITKRCNLHCWFCGQWGNKGFFSDDNEEAMTLDDWKNVIDQLVAYREETCIKPYIMLWGGEPLVSPIFEDIVSYLKDNDFELGIVTNGTLIDKHVETLRTKFERVYISIDGNQEIHDSIRGKGVFEKVKANIALIKGGHAKLISMSVMSDEVLDILPEMPSVLKDVGVDKMILQEMICLDSKEISRYKKDMTDLFSIQATDINSWKFEGKNEEKQKSKLKELFSQKNEFPIKYIHHTYEKYCLSPYNHIHIAWNGNVMYCTDFYDFSAGNVKNEKLLSIFQNEKSNKFRDYISSGKCPTCEHCSWRSKQDYKVLD